MKSTEREILVEGKDDCVWLIFLFLAFRNSYEAVLYKVNLHLHQKKREKKQNKKSKTKKTPAPQQILLLRVPTFSRGP